MNTARTCVTNQTSVICVNPVVRFAIFAALPGLIECLAALLPSG